MNRMAIQRFSVLLLRHGLTDSNQNGMIQGHLPTPLNAAGRQQAARLAQRLTLWKPPVRTLVSSDLARATQTAAAVSAALNLPAIPDPAWRERGLGEFEGKTVGEKRIWQAATGDDTPTGAEPRGDFSARISAALQSLPARFAGEDPVAVITHGGPIRIILRLLASGQLPLAGPIQSPADPMIANCSICHLVLQDDGWQVACTNDVSHLDDASAADAG
jgi:probable phosphoglycerate mutase